MFLHSNANAISYTPNYNLFSFKTNVCRSHGLAYPIVLAYSSISSLVNLSCPLQLAELLLGLKVLCPLFLVSLKISSIAGGLISPNTSSGLISCCLFNWAIRTGDSAQEGLTIEAFLGDSSSLSEYLSLARNQRRERYSESISGRIMDSLGG